MVQTKQRFDFGRFKRDHIASLVACLKAVTGRDYSFLASRFLYVLEKNTKHHGIVFSTKYTKQLYNFAVRVALQYPMEDIEPIPYRRVTRGRLPYDLRPFKHLLGHKNRLVRRCALSILNLHEGVEGPLTFDLETVTTKSTLTSVFLNSLKKEFDHKQIISYLRKGNLKKDDILGLPSMFRSAKSGPNGLALEKAHIDAFALRRDPALRENIIKLLCFDYRTLPAGYSSSRTP